MQTVQRKAEAATKRAERTKGPDLATVLFTEIYRESQRRKAAAAPPDGTART